MKFLAAILLSLVLFLPLFAQETFRLVSYNSLKFPDNSGSTRVPYFKTVIKEIDPDILVLQEISKKNGVDIFLNDILNDEEPYLYSAAPFVDGYDTDNILFFKSREFSLVSNRQIKTSLRDISEYVLKVRLDKNMPNIWIYSTHLKAGDNADEAQQRAGDALLWRKELNKLPAGTNFFVLGDLNFYSPTEKGFIALTVEDGTNGQCFDPANKVGEWHNNRTYAKYHTQSTRTTSLYDGSTGGMDDRFDFILVSDALIDSPEFYAPENNYMAFGNDGFHFNGNINDGTNAAVSKTVANALYHASDHLPVVLDVVWNGPDGVKAKDKIVESFELSAFPNPFNSQTTITFNLPVSDQVRVDVFDVNGRFVQQIADDVFASGKHSVRWDANAVESGVYLCRVLTSTAIRVFKVVLIK